jgi:hypothetical protein
VLSQMAFMLKRRQKRREESKEGEKADEHHGL